MFKSQIDQNKRKSKFEKLLTKILTKFLIKVIVIYFNFQMLIDFLY